MLLRSVCASAVPHLTPPMTLLAASGGGIDPTSALTIYGPIGIIAVLMMIGWLVPKYAYDAVVADRDRLRTLAEASTPLVAKNSEVTAEAIALIHLMQERLDPPPRRRTT